MTAALAASSLTAGDDRCGTTSASASAVVIVLTLLYQRWNTHPVGEAFIGAAMSAIVGIIAGASWLLAAPRFIAGDRIRTASFVVGALALSFVASPLTVIAVAAVVGWFWPEKR